ncbi:hypothetical protein LUZ60_012049 [Juncus effusus]|nr:hypothetical protein LUZ60_012049 [Juncus effusus]
MASTKDHEQGEGEDDQFYESLDRILSSSCSSTSASDTEDPSSDRNPNHRRRRSSVLTRPPPQPPSAAYDVWISEPSSVEERRRRLLQNMGLVSDLPPPSPTSQVRTDHSSSNLPLSPSNSPSRSVSQAETLQLTPSTPTTLRSRSDGYVDSNHVQLRAESEALMEEEEQCRIKNLDNGIEYVVKEVREDGTVEKVKEISTGRHLTIQEFETFLGQSPIVQELMRRQQGAHPEPSRNLVSISVSLSSPSNSTPNSNSNSNSEDPKSPVTVKKKGNWLKGIKLMAGVYHHKHSKSNDSKDSSPNRRLSSVTDEGSEVGSRLSGFGPERIRIRQYGKSFKEFTGVFNTQEIEAHNGAIWSIRFSPDGKYLATAGEDKVINIWEVIQLEKNNNNFNNNNNKFSSNNNNNSLLEDVGLSLSCVELSPVGERKKRGKVQSSRKSVSSDHLVVPDRVFELGEKPVCSLHGHEDDVLDLSWSKSQFLLSSSMDKTVRLWDIAKRACLKTFSHSDYVTCIQFNPVDDKYFISGSLDEKVRVWSIPDRKIVDWYDLHEMVTATCYTPDGQGAMVGSHKGSCHLFDTSENKLHYKSQVDLHGKRRRSSHKKITGFQFVPGSSSEVLVTSADSRIRVVNGTELVHKLKGFKNTSSQISASISSNGKYVISASEDSNIYIWRYPQPTPSSPVVKPKPSSSPAVNLTQSYEHFHCRHVTVAVTWPGDLKESQLGGDTWQERLAWGMVIVTAGRAGEVKVFQNFGFPVHV